MAVQPVAGIAEEQRSLAGRVAVITGAGRGLGRGIAQQLAQRQVEVVLVARTTEEIAAVARAITADGGTAHAVEADLTRSDDLERLASRLDTFAVDIVINNAATVDPLLPSVRLDGGAFHDAFAVNVVAPALLTAHLLPPMLDRGWGRIVNVSSGVVASPGSMIGANVYVTTKAALEGHTLNLAAELEGTGVTANVFRPGLVDTSMQESIRARDPHEIGERLHGWFVSLRDRGRLPSPADVARDLVRRLLGDGTGEVWEAHLEAGPA